MDTPPHTPPPTGHSSIKSLHVHYCDFAYEQKGPFRMAVTDIGDTTARTFAELVRRPAACSTDADAYQTLIGFPHEYICWKIQAPLGVTSQHPLPSFDMVSTASRARSHEKWWERCLGRAV